MFDHKENLNSFFSYWKKCKKKYLKSFYNNWLNIRFFLAYFKYVIF
jgi:hypothetical protein